VQFQSPCGEVYLQHQGRKYTTGNTVGRVSVSLRGSVLATLLLGGLTHSFKTRIDTMIQGFSMQPSSTESVQQLGEELSEILGRVLECKMTVDRSVSILERLQ
jgi:hypothetical protein